jgi:hypothetical protein
MSAESSSSTSSLGDNVNEPTSLIELNGKLSATTDEKVLSDDDIENEYNSAIELANYVYNLAITEADKPNDKGVSPSDVEMDRIKEQAMINWQLNLSKAKSNRRKSLTENKRKLNLATEDLLLAEAKNADATFIILDTSVTPNKQLHFATFNDLVKSLSLEQLVAFGISTTDIPKVGGTQSDVQVADEAKSLNTFLHNKSENSVTTYEVVPVVNSSNQTVLQLTITITIKIATTTITITFKF